MLLFHAIPGVALTSAEARARASLPTALGARLGREADLVVGVDSAAAAGGATVLLGRAPLNAARVVSEARVCAASILVVDSVLLPAATVAELPSPGAAPPLAATAASSSGAAPAAAAAPAQMGPGVASAIGRLANCRVSLSLGGARVTAITNGAGVFSFPGAPPCAAAEGTLLVPSAGQTPECADAATGLPPPYDLTSALGALLPGLGGAAGGAGGASAVSPLTSLLSAAVGAIGGAGEGGDPAAALPAAAPLVEALAGLFGLDLGSLGAALNLTGEGLLGGGAAGGADAGPLGDLAGGLVEGLLGGGLGLDLGLLGDEAAPAPAAASFPGAPAPGPAPAPAPPSLAAVRVAADAQALVSALLGGAAVGNLAPAAGLNAAAAAFNAALAARPALFMELTDAGALVEVMAAALEALRAAPAAAGPLSVAAPAPAPESFARRLLQLGAPAPAPEEAAQVLAAVDADAVLAAVADAAAVLNSIARRKGPYALGAGSPIPDSVTAEVLAAAVSTVAQRDVAPAAAALAAGATSPEMFAQAQSEERLAAAVAQAAVGGIRERLAAYDTVSGARRCAAAAAAAAAPALWLLLV